MDDDAKAPVTVIIPYYNTPDTVERAIASVYNQTLPPQEVILVDDGSSQPVPEEVRHRYPDVQVLRHDRNRWLAAARNTGARAASQPLISYLDSDDEWLPQKLALQLDAWQNLRGRICALGTRAFVHFVHEPIRAETLRPGRGGVVFWSFHRLARFSQVGSAVMRRDLYLEVGGNDETLQKSQDLDMWLRLTAFTGLPIGQLRQRLTIWQLDARSAALSLRSTLQVIEKWDPQREPPPGCPRMLDTREYAKLHQWYLLKCAYRLIATGDLEGAKEFLVGCIEERDGCMTYRMIAQAALEAPRVLLGAGLAYKRMRGRAKSVLTMRDPRWR